MAAPRGFHRGRSQTKATGRTWEPGIGGTTETEFSASGSSILGSGVVPTGEKLTLLRTRGILDLFLESTVTSGGDGFFGAFGIGIVSAAAFAIGVTAVPTPIDEAGWDGWLYHQFFSIHAPLPANDGGAPAAHQRVMIDGKAMRKFDVDDTLFGVLQVVEKGAANMTAYMDTRMLVQSALT